MYTAIVNLTPNNPLGRKHCCGNTNCCEMALDRPTNRAPAKHKISDGQSEIKQQKHWTRKALASLVLAGINIVFVPLAFALTGYVAQNQPIGYVGQERTSSATLTSGNETLYRSEYQRSGWSGNLFAYPISADANVNVALERWGGGGAQAIIDAQNFSSGRFIATMKDDGTGKPFLADAPFVNLSSAQQTSLASAPYTSAQIVNFLRGDRSNEGVAPLMRERSTVLGDIIHSRPLYIADASNPTVLVGANDGMLHAFNAATGAERWAYVPSMLLSKMKNLAANPYTHDYFVDGQFTVGTVNISGNKRVLVGGLGAGGKGLYALNITDLTAASDSDVASKVLWEITPTTVNYATPQNNDGTTNASAYSNLGYTYGIPQIRKINNAGTMQDVVIIGNGINTGGDYQAYLFVIDAASGKLVRAILADTAATTDGTLASPNGIFNPLTIDTNGDGAVDRVYAGDLNGTMWKFDLSSATVASWSASVLHTTSPAQPITATIDATTHPLNGYIVTFATGSELTGTTDTYTCSGAASLAGCTLTAPSTATGDLANTSVHYIYGIWDGAPAGNTTLATQILLDRDYIYPPPPAVGGTTTKVRRVSATAPVWTSGGDKGWKVPLQICDLAGQPTCASLSKTAGGERVVGEGAFISSGRYYVTVHNPNIPYLVPGTDTVVMGENWQLSLYFENGGAKELFMDLNASGLVGSEDRIQYISTDAEVVAGTKTVGASITSPDQDGIAVGKWLSRGVSSQPLLVKLTTLYTTLFSQNPDVTIPSAPEVEQGVAGGHFDTDIYYGSASGGSKATATITVGTTGQTSGFPATLGGIAVDGVIIVPALTVTDIANGTATTTNASAIRTQVNNLTGTSGYTATVSGSTVTVTAPFTGTSYNGKTFTFTSGSSQSLVAASAAVTAVKASRTLTFTNSSSINPTGVSILVNGTEIMTATTPGSAKSSSQLATWVAANSSHADYDITANSSTVTIAAKTAVNSTYDISTLTASSSAGTPTNGILVITGVSSRTTTTSIKCGSTFIGTSAAYQSGDVNGASRLTELYNKINGTTVNGYSIACASSTNPMTCTVTPPAGASACSGVFTLANIATSTNTGPSSTSLSTTTGAAVAGVTAVAAVTQSGWTDFAPALAGATFSGGSDGTVSGDTCDNNIFSDCQQKKHNHQYDDMYDVTGLNMLNPSDTEQNLSMAIPSTGTNFKVLMHNQYLSPAAKLSIGDANYVYNVDHGYISVKNYQTSANLDLATVTTYNRSTVGSLAINLPVDALTSKDWWGDPLHPDVRAGLHPTSATCVMSAAGSKDGNMYRPVIPPANGVAGHGINGWDGVVSATVTAGGTGYTTATVAFSGGGGSGATATATITSGAITAITITASGTGYTSNPTVTISGNGAGATATAAAGISPATSKGARMNGALVVQIIKDTTPNSAIEENVAGRPEYGWRVKSASYSTYVLGEYAMYWHYGPCYGATSTTQSFTYQFTFSNSKDLSNFSFKIDGQELLTSNDPPSSTKSALVTWIIAHKNTLAGYTITGNSDTLTITKADNSLPVVDVTATNLAKGNSKHAFTMWTKTPATDASGCTPSGSNTYCTAPAAGSTDPHIGSLSAGVAGDVSGVVTNTVGNVTTTIITYTDGTTSRTVTTVNANGTTTIVSTDRAGVVTNTTVASTAGGSGTSGLLSGSTSGVGRISWRELIRK